jgi:hypothetical protein
VENQTERRRASTRLVRWTARLWSIASISLILLLCVGEGIYYTGPMEWLGFLFFPLGISVGMILAWWMEGLGGSITVGSLIVFYMIYLATVGTLPKGWAWLAFSVPGFLFLLCWHRSRETSKSPTMDSGTDL